MINKKGQTLVMFLILLPVFIGILAFVIDYGIITYEKNKLNNLIDLSKDTNENIDELLKINNIEKYEKKEKNNCITITYYKNSLFGSIVGIKEYKIKANTCKWERGVCDEK